MTEYAFAKWNDNKLINTEMNRQLEILKRRAEEGDTRALNELKKLAGVGNTEIQIELGQMYFYGEGVTSDYAESVKWYRKAAEQGDEVAQYRLGCVYAAKNLGVEQDYVEAYNWWCKAAEQGYAKAEYMLEWLTPKVKALNRITLKL